MHIESDAEKLKIVLEELNIDPHRLTLTLNYEKPSIIYNILKKKDHISSEFAEFFVKKYPQVNYMFLLEGKGTPLLTVSEVIFQKKTLGFSSIKKTDSENLDQDLNITEKRISIIEKMLTNQNENIKKED